MTEDGQRLFADVLPLDDVDSRSIDLAGRFTELVTRVGQVVGSLSARQALGAWAGAIADAADALTATSGRDRWQRAELQRMLDELVSEAGDGEGPALSPAEVRALLARRLEGRPTRANFRTGHLTICTLQPMRSVPHRVVCLLGLDDGAFPRRGPRDGDDLMLEHPQLGERDPRSEDRQLLLDALLAASERLIVTYSGNDERTNAPRPPAVPVGELLDAIDATVRTDDGPAHRRVVICHPLQPFDPRNFIPGRIAGPHPWSFDPTGLAGARALTGPRSGPRPFIAAPLPPRPQGVVELTDLVRFVERPVRAFLRQRLGISLYSAADEIEDELSVELDGLQRWGVGQRLLEARLRGIDERTAILAEIARGTLPPGVLGYPVINDVSPIVTGIVERAGAVAHGGAGTEAGGEPVDVRVPLHDGRLLSGTVTGVRGDLLLATTFSRVSAKHRIAAWVRLLALTASWPERPFAAATVGRGQRRDDVRTAWIEPLGEDAGGRLAAARSELAILMDLYDRGMREPLPLFCATSAAYADAARRGQDAFAAALKEWETEWDFDKEDREAEHQMAFGGVLTLAEVLDIAPAEDERGDGWVEGAEPESSRFGRTGPSSVGGAAGPRGGARPMTAGAIPLQPVEFDPCGPLPSGVTVLEASAGTGKTYTIAALTARYVAEGVPLERLLLVTFTRIATGELRERVRERLVSVERGLGRRLAGAPAADDEDPVVTLLARGDADRHRDNLARAVAGFDAATIATTHGFCQEMLGGLGIAGDLEPDVTFAEDLSDLVDDVVDDLYVRRFAPSRANPDGAPAFGRAEAAAIARAAIDNPSARLVSADGAVPKMRLGLAEIARDRARRSASGR